MNLGFPNTAAAKLNENDALHLSPSAWSQPFAQHGQHANLSPARHCFDRAKLTDDLEFHVPIRAGAAVGNHERCSSRPRVMLALRRRPEEWEPSRVKD